MRAFVWDSGKGREVFRLRCASLNMTMLLESAGKNWARGSWRLSLQFQRGRACFCTDEKSTNADGCGARTLYCGGGQPALHGLLQRGGGVVAEFSPLAAICLCGAIYLPRKAAVLLPLSIIFVSDVIINAHAHKPLLAVEMLSRYFALGLTVWAGWMIRKYGRLWMVIPASLVGSVAFYAITNAGSWISDPGYQKTFAGLMQSLTTGLPGYEPTWMFFRSTFVSDMLFTGLFVLCMAVTRNRTPELRVAGRTAASVS